MKRIACALLAAAAAALFVSSLPAVAQAADVPPADRVVAMYFHRTQRCPTCLKMGGYAEEAMKTGFAPQLKDRTVGFYYIDFQDEKNAALTKGYRVTGPALIIARVTNNKVVEFKDLKDIWTHVRDKKAFVKYVQENVTAYRKKAGDLAKKSK